MGNPHPKLENLKPFTGANDPRRGKKKKGLEHSVTRLRRLLELTENLMNPITKEIEGFSVAEQLDLAQIIKARKGDTKAYIAILDRLEGKPRQSIDHTTDGQSFNGVVSSPEQLTSLLESIDKIADDIKGQDDVPEGTDK